MESTVKHSSAGRRLRFIGWMTAFALVAAMVVPLTGYVYVAVAQTDPPVAQSEQREGAPTTNPESELWRQARQSREGVSAVRGPGANVFMIDSGETFRQVRMGPVSTFLPLFLGFMALAMLGLHLYTGGGEKPGNPSGKRLPAWSLFDRILHWYVAVLFLMLAITGLSLLFGRAVLIPLLGPEGFAAWARASKFLHDWGGVLFVAGIAVMSVAWLHHNKPTMVDVRWLLKGGAFGKHLPAGRYNGGQKIWFLVNVLAGVVVCVTGILLLLPNIFENRELFQISLIIHAVVAIVWLGISFAHIYMATIGAPGSVDITTKGHVSSEWAQLHRPLWYDEIKDQEFTTKPGSASAPKV